MIAYELGFIILNNSNVFFSSQAKVRLHFAHKYTCTLLGLLGLASLDDLDELDVVEFSGSDGGFLPASLHLM